MPIEIKELVIRTVLETGGANAADPKVPVEVQEEIRKQIKKLKAEVITQCMEAVNDGIKRQNER